MFGEGARAGEKLLGGFDGGLVDCQNLIKGRVAWFLGAGILGHAGTASLAIEIEALEGGDC